MGYPSIQSYLILSGKEMRQIGGKLKLKNKPCLLQLNEVNEKVLSWLYSVQLLPYNYGKYLIVIHFPAKPFSRVPQTPFRLRPT